MNENPTEAKEKLNAEIERLDAENKRLTAKKERLAAEKRRRRVFMLITIPLISLALIIGIIWTVKYFTNSQTEDENILYEATEKTENQKAIAVTSGSFIDSRNNKTYKTITIGNQTWMVQNLNYGTKGSKCYGNDESNCQRYGRLYNWAAATKACPSGWHLPSNKEWEILYRYADGTRNTESPYKSETAGRYLKAKSGWNDNEGYSGNGTDDYSFSALPGGLGNSSGGFSSLGNYGNWWSSTEYDDSRAYNRFKSYKHDKAGWETETKSKLFSVRCVMD